MRLIRQLIATTIVAIAALTVLATAPAGAHTGFESSDPADGATVDGPLDAISLVFTGPAEPTGTGFEILDGSGTLRTPTDASTADGLTWVLRFDPPLDGGQVGVRWMVKAPDAHPIDGSFSFTINAAPPRQPRRFGPPASQKPSTSRPRTSTVPKTWLRPKQLSRLRQKGPPPLISTRSSTPASRQRRRPASAQWHVR
ncbi:MAG: copper resistance protein CopC [Acidimicrobiales bacterium]